MIIIRVREIDSAILDMVINGSSSSYLYTIALSILVLDLTI